MSVNFAQPIDFDAYAGQYNVEQRTRIHNVFDADVSHKIREHLAKDISYTNAFTQDGQNHTATEAEIKSWSRDKQREFLTKLYGDASKGVGFYYGRSILDRSTDINSLSGQVFEWLNSQNTLNVIKQITGAEDIVAASAQATRYTPGQYLTRHNDVHEGDQRRVAYVLNFTDQWHPDWGGNLQFYQQDGTPRDAWAPLFNSMTLFDVNHVHAVTYLAPFALRYRFSITGWFRAKPL